MGRFTLLLISVLSVNMSGQTRAEETGPYTVSEISGNVFHIEDGNTSNPPGVIVGDDGQLVSMNNCSDMYLIVGQEKGLLIDLGGGYVMNTLEVPGHTAHSTIFILEGEDLVFTGDAI